MKKIFAVVCSVFLASMVLAADGTVATTQGDSASKNYSYCQVINPGMRDQSGRYCTTGYGVVHGGYIVDNTCYYNSNDAYNAMNSYACSFAPPVYIGSCHLDYPSQRDLNGQYCDNTYGVDYNGQILNRTCYYTMHDAIQAMQTSSICQNGGGGGQGNGYCSLSYPGVRDRANRYCNGSYGFQYDGYIANNTCYFNLNDAINAMSSEGTCQIPPPLRYGRCTVFNPGVRDYANRYCDNMYGVDYNGYILDNACYQTLSGVTQAMQASPFCQ